jgi:hypothetical protein
MIGCLAQVSEILPKHGILTREFGEVVQPGDRGELEVMVRLKTSQYLDIAFIDLMRRDDPVETDRFVAAAMPACWFFHA